MVQPKETNEKEQLYRRNWGGRKRSYEIIKTALPVEARVGLAELSRRPEQHPLEMCHTFGRGCSLHTPRTQYRVEAVEQHVAALDVLRSMKLKSQTKH